MRVVRANLENRICEILGHDGIFGKRMMNNVQLPKISCIMQFADEIWALLDPVISIQTNPDSVLVLQV